MEEIDGTKSQVNIQERKIISEQWPISYEKKDIKIWTCAR